MDDTMKISQPKNSELHKAAARLGLGFTKLDEFILTATS
jgi:hypothetical protein